NCPYAHTHHRRFRPAWTQLETRLRRRRSHRPLARRSRHHRCCRRHCALAHGSRDITVRAAASAAARDSAAAAVIHCAALTDTARCEKEPALARQINGIGSEHVAKACRAIGARLIAISTNEVFAGTKREPYIESDATGPLNAYA